MFNLSMLRTFNSTEMLGIWFLLAVGSMLIAWLFDWLMNKSGIGLIAGTLATAFALVAGLHFAERFVILNWNREPLAMDLPVIVMIVALTVVIVVLGLSVLKRKFFDN